MNRWICKGCNNPCIVINEFTIPPEHCTIWGGQPMKWVEDTGVHETVDCKSYICEQCGPPCYHVKLGSSKAQEHRENCPVSGSSNTWRLLT